MGLILLGTLEDLLALARVWVRYNAHLPALSLQDGDNLQTLLTKMFLPNLHVHILCKNCSLCMVCWGEFKRKTRTSLPHC